MTKIAVLGAGLVGKAIAYDLSQNYDVTSIDYNPKALEWVKSNTAAQTQQADLSASGNITTLVAPFDLVVIAVPGFMGYAVLESVLKAGKNVVDISFFPEDATPLHAVALANNCTAIVDCGVAPGMNNILLGYHNERMQVEQFECLVGGLPKIKVPPFEYKAPFSPLDVIEEYLRPARFLANGQLVTKPALSEPEIRHFEPVGPLESFLTDGLRSLLYTMKHIPDMKEKTLRYPGHVQLIGAFIAAGFLDEQPVEVNGQFVVPRDVTSKLLLEQWRLGPNEPEFTIMEVNINGQQDGAPMNISYHLYDEFDTNTQLSSMARTTAFTCTAVVQLLLNGSFDKKGVFPPEIVGQKTGCCEQVLEYLKARNIHYNLTTKAG